MCFSFCEILFKIIFLFIFLLEHCSALSSGDAGDWIWDLRVPGLKVVCVRTIVSLHPQNIFQTALVFGVRSSQVQLGGDDKVSNRIDFSKEAPCLQARPHFVTRALELKFKKQSTAAGSGCQITHPGTSLFLLLFSSLWGGNWLRSSRHVWIVSSLLSLPLLLCYLAVSES